MISAHFDGKKGYMLVWKDNEAKIKLRGHNGRILGFKLNPLDDNQGCSLGADETLRTWSTSYKNSTVEDPPRPNSKNLRPKNSKPIGRSNSEE